MDAGRLRSATFERIWIDLRLILGGPNLNPYCKYWYKTHVGLFLPMLKKIVKMSQNELQNTSKIYQKSIKKRLGISLFFMNVFFHFFHQKWSPKGAGGAPKNTKKHKKSEKVVSEIFPGFDLPFGSDFGWIWGALGSIFGDFWWFFDDFWMFFWWFLVASEEHFSLLLRSHVHLQRHTLLPVRD